MPPRYTCKIGSSVVRSFFCFFRRRICDGLRMASMTHVCAHMPVRMLLHVSTLACAHVHTHIYIRLYTCLHMSLYVSVHMPIHMPIHMSAHMSAHMSVRMSLYMSAHQSAHMCVHMRAHMHIHMPMYMSLQRTAGSFVRRSSCNGASRRGW